LLTASDGDAAMETVSVAVNCPASPITRPAQP
jgi:hypothetical protein